MHAVVRGAVAGIVATVPMTAFVLGARALGLIGTPPPRQIAANAAWTAGVRDDMREEHFNAFWLATHLGYGAACGAVFALLRSILPLPLPRDTAGLAFG